MTGTLGSSTDPQWAGRLAAAKGGGGKRRFSSDIAYNLLCSKALNYIYINCPKCACSTVKASLWSNEFRVGAFPLPLQAVPRDAIHILKADAPSPYSIDPELIERKMANAFVFTFVRNPYCRILSSYIDKIERRSQRFIVEEFRQRYGIPRIESVDFTSFLRYLVNDDPAAFNNHWKPLSLLTHPDQIEPDFIGRVESFESDMAFVMSRIFGSEAESVQVDHHSTDARAMMSKYYSKEAIALLLEIYRSDFELFGYSTDIAVYPAA